MVIDFEKPKSHFPMDGDEHLFFGMSPFLEHRPVLLDFFIVVIILDNAGGALSETELTFLINSK